MFEIMILNSYEIEIILDVFMVKVLNDILNIELILIDEEILYLLKIILNLGLFG